MALPAYELLPLGFGLAGALRGFLKRDTASIRLGIWALVAVVLALIYPGKQTGDLAWALLPLWTLAAIELGHHFDFEGGKLLRSITQENINNYLKGTQLPTIIHHYLKEQ